MFYKWHSIIIINYFIFLFSVYGVRVAIPIDAPLVKHYGLRGKLNGGSGWYDLANQETDFLAKHLDLEANDFYFIRST